MTETFPLYLLVYPSVSKKGEGKRALCDEVAETADQKRAIRGLALESTAIYKVEADGTRELVYFEDAHGTEFGAWPDEEPINVGYFGQDHLTPPEGR